MTEKSTSSTHQKFQDSLNNNSQSFKGAKQGKSLQKSFTHPPSNFQHALKFYEGNSKTEQEVIIFSEFDSNSR